MMTFSTSDITFLSLLGGYFTLYSTANGPFRYAVAYPVRRSSRHRATVLRSWK